MRHKYSTNYIVVNEHISLKALKSTEAWGKTATSHRVYDDRWFLEGVIATHRKKTLLFTFDEDFWFAQLTRGDITVNVDGEGFLTEERVLDTVAEMEGMLALLTAENKSNSGRFAFLRKMW